MSGAEVGRTKFKTGQSLNTENGHIEFESSKMSGFTKMLLFVAAAVTVVGVIASVIMLGVLVGDKDSGSSGNNLGDTGAQVGTTTTVKPTSKNKECI